MLKSGWNQQRQSFTMALLSALHTHGLCHMTWYTSTALRCSKSMSPHLRELCYRVAQDGFACLVNIYAKPELPSGYKTLGQVAWTPSLGVEALRTKVVRLRPSKKREGKERRWERIDDFWFLVSSHWDLYICSDSSVLDSQSHFNESPLSLKSAGRGLP